MGHVPNKPSNLQLIETSLHSFIHTYIFLWNQIMCTTVATYFFTLPCAVCLSPSFGHSNFKRLVTSSQKIAVVHSICFTTRVWRHQRNKRQATKRGLPFGQDDNRQTSVRSKGRYWERGRLPARRQANKTTSIVVPIKPLNNNVIIIASALDVVCSEYYLFVCQKGFILIIFSIIIILDGAVTKSFIFEMSTIRSSALLCFLGGDRGVIWRILDSKKNSTVFVATTTTIIIIY